LLIGALYTLIKIKQIDDNYYSFSLPRQFIRDSEKLPLFFVTVCAVNWSYAAVNIITIFSATHSL